MLAADRKKRHGFCEEKKPQKPRPFLRQLKQALCFHKNHPVTLYKSNRL